MTIHGSQFDVPVGNIFDIWELVEPLVEHIRRNPGEDWSYTLTLGAGTRSFATVLGPLEGIEEPVAHRTRTFYRTPRSETSVLCVSCIRGVVAAEVIPLEDVTFDAEDDVPAEFLHG